MTKAKKVNILIDGPSRSGKLLLAKLLLASPDLAFQHYSGDAERILEAIYMSKSDTLIREKLIELLRINLVHTIEDLRNCRQLSINANDSSYYKKTLFFKENEGLFDNGKVAEEIMSSGNGFVVHTHESAMFLDELRGDKQFEVIEKHLLQQQISIARNPAAQSLSWISRKYTEKWNFTDKLTPFSLYKSKHKLNKLVEDGVNRFPWFVDKSLDYYLCSGAITENELKNLDHYELIILAVCYLTEVYLKTYTSWSKIGFKRQNRHFVFHENLHDNSITDVKNILQSIGLKFDEEILNTLYQNETNSKVFGRESMETSAQSAKNLISQHKVLDILDSSSKHYSCILDGE